MELIENANKEALERFLSAEPVLVDVVPAREAISGSEDRMPADADNGERVARGGRPAACGRPVNSDRGRCRGPCIQQPDQVRRPVLLGSGVGPHRPGAGLADARGFGPWLSSCRALAECFGSAPCPTSNPAPEAERGGKGMGFNPCKLV